MPERATANVGGPRRSVPGPLPGPGPSGTPVPPSSGALLGRVFPMPPGSARDRPWETEAEGLVWRDGRVVHVGSRASVLDAAGRHEIPRDAVQELAPEHFVMPGFVDAHMHFLSVGLKRTRPDLHAATSLEDAKGRVQAWLREEAAAAPAAGSGVPAAPVVAEGWDEAPWPGRRRPTRADLDAVLAEAGQGGRPMVWRRVDGHIAVASTGALPAIQRRWSDPALVDAASGILLEDPSLYLNEAFPATPAQLRSALEAAQDDALRLGVTTLGDYAQAPYREEELAAAREGRLRVRIVCSVYAWQFEAELARGFRTGRPARGPDGRPSPFLQDGALKLFLDGSLGARTAALRGHYVDAPPGTPADCPSGPDGAPRSRHGCVGHAHVRGTLNWGDADVAALVARAVGAGVQVHAHAIGDAAIDQGLEAFAAADRAAARRHADRTAAGHGAGGQDKAGQEEAGEAAAGHAAGHQAAADVGAGHPAGDARASPDGGSKGPAAAGPGGNARTDDAARRAGGSDAGARPAGGMDEAGTRGSGAVRRLRCRFEHFEIAHDAQVAEAARLGVVASAQPNFVGTWSSKGGMYEQRLGAAYAINNRFRTFLAAGLEVAFGSDGMPFGPLVGIQAACSHPDARERLPPLQAAWLYTERAAWSLHAETVGALVPGRWADLVELQGDVADAGTWAVRGTWVAGVHSGV